MDHAEATSILNSPEHQVARWRHSADWWSGKIVPSVSDRERARHAVEQVRIWTERLAVC